MGVLVQDGTTPLLLAAEASDTVAMKALLATGCAPDANKARREVQYGRDVRFVSIVS